MSCSSRLVSSVVLFLVGVSPAFAGPPDLIYQDDFNLGNWSAWTQIVAPNAQPNCNCYFSGDCLSGEFCNWGPGGPFTEDICNYRLPKPGGVPGNGCNSDAPGPGAICDGYCSPTAAGSVFANEKQRRVQEAIELWTDALLRPAERVGGGPVDAELAQRALAVPFEQPAISWTLGRHVADVLMLTASPGFYDHFCHFEFGHESPEFFVDLSAEPCRVQAGYLAVRALLGEYLQNGQGVGDLEQIKAVCPAWQEMFSPRCPNGPGALECLKGRILDAAVYLRTVEHKVPDRR